MPDWSAAELIARRFEVSVDAKRNKTRMGAESGRNDQRQRGFSVNLQDSWKVPHPPPDTLPSTCPFSCRVVGGVGTEGSLAGGQPEPSFLVAALQPVRGLHNSATGDRGSPAAAIAAALAVLGVRMDGFCMTQRILQKSRATPAYRPILSDH